MAELKDLINALECDDVEFQFLTHGNVDFKIKGRKNKYLEVKFETDVKALALNKEAVIIWVDKDKLSDAMQKAVNPNNTTQG